ncbi:hypothetical protein [Catellatospora sp. NPDC049609]|uniref:hypothetical protein n=1 Tax=Catellatospora sp. NPDC049609 TaxID=3155505 RepID=UPI0034311069
MDEPTAAERLGLQDWATKAGFGCLLTPPPAPAAAPPIRLRGEVLTVPASTGAVLERFSTDTLRDNVLYKP